MIVNYSCNNFKSFKNEVNFSLIPEPSITNLKENINNNLLKGLLFVGANASGKTNSISVLELLLEILYFDDFQMKNYVNIFTRKDISMEYRFNIDNSIIDYKLNYYTSLETMEEFLYIDSQIVFHRQDLAFTSHTIKNITIEKEVPAIRNVLEKATGKLSKLYDFLNNSAVIDLYNNAINGSKYKHYNPRINYTSKEVDLINDFLKTYNFEYRIAMDKETGIIDDVYFLRIGCDVKIPFKMESIGNRNLIYILPIFKEVMQNNGMLILDEFGSCMHNELEQLLVRYFMTNSKMAQIFMVSHSTNLLSNSLLRADQIYSLDFIDSSTIAERFSKENPRKGQNLEKMYLGGVFGGLPKYTKE
ncbi:MAG: AAA family ATPase [Lachnospirales bacterium]